MALTLATTCWSTSSPCPTVRGPRPWRWPAPVGSCSRDHRAARSPGVRVVAALGAAAARLGHRVGAARGRAGPARPRRARPGPGLRGARAAMSPLDENHQALVIRLYRLSGDDDAAERQYGAFARLLDAELGVGPCAVVEAARHERPRAAVEVTTDRAVEAVIESGSAAIAAGAIDPGITSLRSAVPLADADGATHLRVESRLALAEALIHSVRGLDEEGQAAPARGRPPGPGPRRPGHRGAGPGRAGVRGLPAGPLRPCRALAHRRHRDRTGLTGGAGEGHDLPRVGRTATAGATRRRSPCSTRPPG